MSWKRLQDSKLQRRLKIRSRVIQLLREFFVKEGFLEIETPILVPYAGQEPYLEPMRACFLDDKHRPRGGYLITSPEYSHKKLLAAGFEKIFEITKCFRGGEPAGGFHNPEFTILEWYRARADYWNVMNDVEKMVFYVVSHLPLTLVLSPKGRGKGEGVIKYQGRAINLTPPWQRISMQEAWEKYAGVKNPAKFLCDRTKISLLCRQKGYSVKKNDTFDDLFFKIFLTEIEPKLGFSKPTILYDYPAQMAALAQLKPPTRFPSLDGRGKGGKGRVKQQWTERFEVYIAGMELANAFSELNDAREQRRRFLAEQKLRKKLGKKIIPLDEDFLDAVGQMPPAAGIAFGIDRLIMFLVDAANIEETLAFPAGEIFKT